MKGKNKKEAFISIFLVGRYMLVYLDCRWRILCGHVGREDRSVEGEDHERRHARHKVEDPRRRRPHRDRVVALQKDHGHQGEGVQQTEILRVGLKHKQRCGQHYV